jgi:hypothetical protein
VSEDSLWEEIHRLERERDALIEELQGLRLALQLQDAAFKETLDALGEALGVIEEVWDPYMDPLGAASAHAAAAKIEAVHAKYTKEDPNA